MRTFTCLFKDERYSVPTLSFYFTEDEQTAMELASRDLSANPHYESFEISEDGRPLCFAGRNRRSAAGFPAGAPGVTGNGRTIGRQAASADEITGPDRSGTSGGKS